MTDMNGAGELSDARIDELLAGIGDDTFAGITRTVELKVPEARALIAEVKAARANSPSPSPAKGEAEPVAWRWRAKVKGEWSLWSVVEVDPNDWTWRDYWEELEVVPLYASPLPVEDRQVRVKPLEWVDADEGMCTKWRAAALGGHYELVDFGKDDPGFAVNFHWGRPLSFWFIQGEPDELGPTGPKIFPTLEAAKAAAQADYESRILSALSPSTLGGDAGRLALSQRGK